MARKRLEWKLKQRSWHLGTTTLVGAILDISPDGADQGRYQDPDRAYVRAAELTDAGAAFIELSHAPLTAGKPRVSDAEEIRRMVPVLKRLQGKLEIPIAVQTAQSTVAAKAFEYGAEILHDPSGLIYDPAVASMVALADAALIMSHLRAVPESWVKLPPMKEAVMTVTQDLSASVSRAARANIDRQRIVIDVGLGQGKRKEQDLELLSYLGKLSVLALPICVSPSRQAVLPTPAEEAAAVAAAIFGGAHVVRIHAIETLRPAALLADAILSATLLSPTAAGTPDRSGSRAEPRPSSAPRPRR